MLWDGSAISMPCFTLTNSLADENHFHGSIRTRFITFQLDLAKPIDCKCPYTKQEFLKSKCTSHFSPHCSLLDIKADLSFQCICQMCTGQAIQSSVYSWLNTICKLGLYAKQAYYLRATCHISSKLKTISDCNGVQGWQNVVACWWHLSAFRVQLSFTKS